MKCRLCEDKFLEYLYGELSQEDAAAMEKHLEESEECRQAYKGFATVLETVAGVDEEGLPGPIHTRIMGHAEEAGSKKRPLWAWMFRPAVTTAVIGAITAGVYFTTMRHKPPSYRDERIVFEESAPAKSKQGGAPPPSRAKADSLEKAEKVQALRARPAELPATVGEGRAEPEEREQDAVKKSVPRTIGSPYGLEDRFMAAEKMDEKYARVLERERAEAMHAQKGRAITGRTERLGHRPPRDSAIVTALPASREPGLATMKTEVPDPIAGALDLASQGKCTEAEKQVEAYFAEYPKEAACGAGWLGVARCYFKKGDSGAARKTAEKALAIPAYAKEAQTFLEFLPSTAE